MSNVKMKKMYVKAFEDFFEKVNKLQHVSLTWDNAYDAKTNNMMYRNEEGKVYGVSSKMGSDKLLLAFQSNEGNEMRTVYGFRNYMPQNVSRGSVSSLAYSGRSAGVKNPNVKDKLGSGIFGNYGPDKANGNYRYATFNNDDTVENLHRHTSRVFNNVFTYGMMFEGYQYPEQFRPFVENISTASDAERMAIREETLETISFGSIAQYDDNDEFIGEIPLSSEKLERFLMLDRLAATYINPDDVPVDMVQRTLGLDKFYEILETVDRELGHSDKPIDLASRMLQIADGTDFLTYDSEDAVLGLNMASMYGVIKRNANLATHTISELDDIKDNDAVYVTSGLYDVLVHVNSDRHNVEYRSAQVFNKATDVMGTNVHAYGKYVAANTGYVTNSSYDKNHNLTVAEKYRLYREAIGVTKQDEAMQIPLAKIIVSEKDTHKEFNIEYNNEIYSLNDFVEGKGVCAGLRDNFPALSAYSADQLSNITTKVYGLISTNIGDDVEEFDLLSPEIYAFQYGDPKADKNSKYIPMKSALVENCIESFNMAHDKAVADYALISHQINHNVNKPSAEKGSYEIGKFIRANLDKVHMGMISENPNDAAVESFVNEGPVCSAVVAMSAHNVRVNDLRLRKLDIMGEKLGTHNYEETIRKNNSIFGVTNMYDRILSGYVKDLDETITQCGGNVADPRCLSKCFKINDFMVLVDTYTPTSEKAMRVIYNDIESLYEGVSKYCTLDSKHDSKKISNYGSKNIYRPKDKYEVEILRSLCEGSNILDRVGVAPVAGGNGVDNKSFVNVVSSLARTVQANGFSVDKAIVAANNASRYSDTVIPIEESFGGLEPCKYAEVTDTLKNIKQNNVQDRVHQFVATHGINNEAVDDKSTVDFTAPTIV